MLPIIDDGQLIGLVERHVFTGDSPQNRQRCGQRPSKVGAGPE